MTHLFGLTINILLVLASIFIHYEVLNRLSRVMPLLPFRPRARIIVGVITAVIAHSAEIGLFALGYQLSSHLGYGTLVGNFEGTFGDYMYFSYASYTTVGFGDIFPEGGLRWLAGIEALTGFVLVTWTASYLFLEMSQNWRHD